MNPVLSMAVLLLIAVVAFSIVLGIGLPVIDASKQQALFRDAENAGKLIDNAIRDIAAEGKGAVRVIEFTSPEFVSLPEEDALEFKMTSGAELLEHLTRRFVGSIVYISGSDVSCTSDGNITVENNRIQAVFQKVSKASPYSNIDTARNLLSIKEKGSGTTVSITNSSIVIDGNLSSASGNGYSELLRSGSSLPACTVHFFINSTSSDYDAYYTLYSGADFLVVDVRNVK